MLNSLFVLLNHTCYRHCVSCFFFLYCIPVVSAVSSVGYIGYSLSSPPVVQFSPPLFRHINASAAAAATGPRLAAAAASSSAVRGLLGALADATWWPPGGRPAARSDQPGAAARDRAGGDTGHPAGDPPDAHPAAAHLAARRGRQPTGATRLGAQVRTAARGRGRGRGM